MATAPNTTVVTGPNFNQSDASTMLVTPTGGTQATMADMLGGKAAVPSLNVGTVTITSTVNEAVTNGITASTTQTLVGALLLTTPMNIITKVGTAGDTVKLPAATALGQQVWVFNQGASACSVFPFEVTTSIDAGTTAAAVTLTNAKNAVFINNTATTWISSQGGSKSA